MIQQVTGTLFDSQHPASTNFRQSSMHTCTQHVSQEDIMFYQIATKHTCTSQTLNWTPRTFTYHLLDFTVYMTFYLAFNLAFYLWHLIWHSIWHSLWHFFWHPDLTFLSDILSAFFLGAKSIAKPTAISRRKKPSPLGCTKCVSEPKLCLFLSG